MDEARLDSLLKSDPKLEIKFKRNGSVYGVITQNTDGPETLKDITEVQKVIDLICKAKKQSLSKLIMDGTIKCASWEKFEISGNKISVKGAPTISSDEFAKNVKHIELKPGDEKITATLTFGSGPQTTEDINKINKALAALCNYHKETVSNLKEKGIIKCTDADWDKLNISEKSISLKKVKNSEKINFKRYVAIVVAGLFIGGGVVALCKTSSQDVRSGGISTVQTGSFPSLDDDEIYSANDEKFDTCRADNLDSPDARELFVNTVEDYISHGNYYDFKNIAAYNDRDTIDIINKIWEEGDYDKQIDEYVFAGRTTLTYDGVNIDVVPYRKLFALDQYIPLYMVKNGSYEHSEEAAKMLGTGDFQK